MQPPTSSSGDDAAESFPSSRRRSRGDAESPSPRQMSRRQYRAATGEQSSLGEPVAAPPEPPRRSYPAETLRLDAFTSARTSGAPSVAAGPVRTSSADPATTALPAADARTTALPIADPRTIALPTTPRTAVDDDLREPPTVHTTTEPAPVEAAGITSATGLMNALATPERPTTTEVATLPEKTGSAVLAWVDPETVSGTAPTAPAGKQVAADLLADVPMRRSRAWVVPTLLLAAACVGYAVATIAWPTSALPPTISAAPVESKATVPPEIQWPGNGSSAVGIGPSVTSVSSDAATSMASITKVVTVLTILERKPLAPGEQGESFTFTQEDSDAYWNEYRGTEQSAVDVPVDGSLTYYQMLEGIMLGSANNYTDRLSQWALGDDAAYATAANDFLGRNGITGIHVVEPTGFDPANTATPAALVQLARLAEQQPVIAEIAAMPSVELPGAGLVENSNDLIGDPGVVGLKTGTLDKYNLLSAKNITVGGETVQAYAAVLDQPAEADRDSASRAIYSQVETALQPQVAVPKDTTVANVTTAWGESTSVVTSADATVSLWNKQAEITRGTKLGEDLTKGAKAGTLTVAGALGDATVDVELTKSLDGPDFMWRLTHPLQLFGLSQG